MSVDEYGILRHIWYGRNTGCDMSYLGGCEMSGFSGNISEAGDRREYSLDTLPLEYAVCGVGDYRITALSVINSDRSNAVDLRYSGYKVYDGKYPIEGLPAVYDNGGEAQTLEIYLEDKISGIKVTLKYGVFEKKDIITRSAVIENGGHSAVTLQKALSFTLDIRYGKWDKITLCGRYALEHLPKRIPLEQGIYENSSNRGASSHQQNPSIILCDRQCTEQSGECYGALLMYSGSFTTQVECTQLGSVRLNMGINPELFSWELAPGENFNTPEAILTYSSNGISALSRNFHRIIRNNVCRGKYKTIERPVLFNSWEAVYFDFDEKKLIDLAEKASKLGAELFVLDDGWFGKRDSDTSGLGDWFVNENKLHGGLEYLSKRITELGMKLGIWFEPEMISEDSDLYRKHPDWVVKIPDRLPTRSRFQLALDMSRADVRDYLYERISSIVKSASIAYIKWDMNRSLCDWAGDDLPHKYVLGLYELLERVTATFPDLMIEGCSGGGGRFDAGMLYYTPQIWCSDNTDAYDRTKIQYGTSLFYPVSSIGSHISAVPNHQTGRVTSIEARAAVAMHGSFGLELNPDTLTEEEKNAVLTQLAKFKKYASLIHNGDYYRLGNPINASCVLWEYVSEDKSEILVQGLILSTPPYSAHPPIRLCGVDENKNYRLEATGEIFSGKQLLYGGLFPPYTLGDYAPVEWKLRETVD